jgi:hypothetical protein
VLKLCVVCVLTVASAAVWAQPAPGSSVRSQSSERAATDQAQAALGNAMRRANQLGAQRGKLQQHYTEQLAAVDRLKNERASWRRDRELKASLADSADTASQLDVLNKQLASATGALAQARRTFAAAIDAELAAGATGARGDQLAKWRAELEATLGATHKKIVMPDDVKIDQLDPEDLEQQAQIIADTEKQLATQVAGLDQQAEDLSRLAELRKSHDRANDMMIREDDQPHRDVQHSTNGTGTLTQAPATGPTGGAASPAQNGASGAGGGNDFNGDHGSSFETEAPFVLGEVIDPSTLDTLARASRSGDPAKRAAAARATRDAVAARLEQLKKKRALIEQREKQLKR